jgi:uncharacterized membrane-anchored protein
MSNDSNESRTVTTLAEQEQENLESSPNSSATTTMPALKASPSQAYAHLRKPFITAIVLQMAILLFLGGFNMYVLAAGRTVLLKTIPVDPWDMFRGDYLALNYDVSTIKSAKHYEAGKEVFVVLEKHNPYWSVSYVSDKLPELTGDQVALKGKINYALDNEIHVRYGLEQYYVPEGKGVLPPHTTPDTEVAVDRFGNAAIKQLVLHGKKLEL